MPKAALRHNLMGGRGTFAKGNSVSLNYETVGHIEGVPIVKGINGNFYEMRIYDKDHYLLKEIAYHPEYKLTGKI